VVTQLGSQAIVSQSVWDKVMRAPDERLLDIVRPLMGSMLRAMAVKDAEEGPHKWSVASLGIAEPSECSLELAGGHYHLELCLAGTPLADWWELNRPKSAAELDALGR
jgi:hypothetical protein|tara:strand:- start:95 stop:418 length:324 start_codon:yes stop_codon:yes gene_type:complete